jgi:L-ribulose-5-phosphate 3-epimerase
MYNRRRFVGLAASAAAFAGAARPQAEGKALRLGLIVSAGKDPEAAIRKVHDLGFPTCQVGVHSFEPDMATRLRAALDRFKIEATSLVSGGPGPEIYDFYQGPLTIGLVPRASREARIAQVKKTSDFAKQCGVPAVQTHCGFIPENPNDTVYKEAVEAIRTVAAYCKQNGQSFRCETGQETPITLFRAIHDVGLDNVGINFDAANLILYGKANPVDAIDLLGPLVMGIHAKDGLYPTNPKELGREVPIGQGKVNFPVFIEKLKKIGYRGPLTIEREISGPQQTEDVRAAKAYLEKLVG